MKPRRVIITTEAETNMSLDEVRRSFGPKGSCSMEISLAYGARFARVLRVEVQLATRARAQRLARSRATVRHP